MRPLKTIIQIIIISGAFSSWMWMAISFIEFIYDDVPMNFWSIILFNLFYAAGIVVGVRIKRKKKNRWQSLEVLRPEIKCYKCGNKIKFLLKVKREAWQTSIKCKYCSFESLIIYSDKMSGASHDTVIINGKN